MEGLIGWCVGRVLKEAYRSLRRVLSPLVLKLCRWRPEEARGRLSSLGLSELVALRYNTHTNRSKSGHTSLSSGRIRAV